MEWTKIWTILCVCLIYLIAECASLHCHWCWTKDLDACGDSQTLPAPSQCGPKENVCKKIVTKYFKIMKKGRDSKYELLSNVTSRLCGQADWEGCRRLNGAASSTIECACKGDGCNSAHRYTASMAVFFLTVFTFSWIYVR